MKKEDFNKIFKLKKEADLAVQSVELARWRVLRTTSPIDRDYIQQNPSDISEGISLISDAEQHAQKLAREWVDLRNQIDQVITSLPNETQRSILRLRFCDGLPWQQIADKMCYDVRSCTRIAKSALETLGIE